MRHQTVNRGTYSHRQIYIPPKHTQTLAINLTSRTNCSIYITFVVYITMLGYELYPLQCRYKLNTIHRGTKNIEQQFQLDRSLRSTQNERELSAQQHQGKIEKCVQICAERVMYLWYRISVITSLSSVHHPTT